MSGSPPKGFSSEGYVSRPDSESAQPGDGVALSARAAQKIQVRDVGAHVDACADADGADGVSQVHASTHSWRSDDISELILSPRQSSAFSGNGLYSIIKLSFNASCSKRWRVYPSSINFFLSSGVGKSE